MHNQILRSSVSVLLIFALFVTGLFYWPDFTYAATKTETVTKTETIHDLAYYDIWKHADGTWQKGKKQKSEVMKIFAYWRMSFQKRGRLYGIELIEALKMQSEEN